MKSETSQPRAASLVNKGIKKKKKYCVSALLYYSRMWLLASVWELFSINKEHLTAQKCIRVKVHTEVWFLAHS